MRIFIIAGIVFLIGFGSSSYNAYVEVESLKNEHPELVDYIDKDKAVQKEFMKSNPELLEKNQEIGNTLLIHYAFSFLLALIVLLLLFIHKLMKNEETRKRKRLANNGSRLIS